MGAVQFSEEVDKRNLNDRIAYVGRKVGEEKEAFFRQSDVFVFPTYYYNECFPLVILEAMEYKMCIRDRININWQGRTVKSSFFVGDAIPSSLQKEQIIK